MGAPNFVPSALPMEYPHEQLTYSLNVNGIEMEIGAVSMGNPHAVLRVPEAATAKVTQVGREVERHPRFPKRTNAGFMQVVSRGHIVLRVFERGVGETLACGTGACAAVAIGRRWGLLDTEVRVDLPGGSATVSWAGFDQHVWLTGPARTVFTGSIDLTRFMGDRQ
jgi:diaminopimelate epimerase